MNTIVIFHGGCPDGVGAAWCFKDLADEFYAASFGKTIPLELVEDKKVIFVDFTYRRDEMKTIIEVAEDVIVLDHHKTAYDLEGLENLTLNLDMDRSGAQMAWDYVNNNKPRPWFIDDIADRDLWQWKIPNSKYTTRAMHAQNYYKTIEDFDKLVGQDREKFVDLGKILCEMDEEIYTSLCKRAIDCICTSVKDPSKKWKVKVVECDHMYASEVGNRLSKTCDFAAIYRYDLPSDEWWISMRANGEIDLTEVAKLFDKGGGHKSAAGITLFGSKGQTLKSVFVPI